MSSLGPWLGSRRSGFDDTWFNSPFSSDSWDPFDLGVSLIRSASSSGGGGGGGGDVASALALANVDWRETDNAHIFRADLPGVRKEELKVQVEEDNNILEISGERVKEEEDKNDKWHRVERRRGRFVRRFRLPENADLDNVKCGLENGVLTVTVPKKEVGETQKNVRHIDVA